MSKDAKYLQVIEDIHRALMICDLPANIGLHTGTSGIALFFAYYERIIKRNNDICPKIMDILEHNIKCMDSGYYIYSICNGISGFGWFCEHLRKLGILHKDDIEFLDDVDPFLHRMMIADMQKGNYDFLHGALGVALYFLSRFDPQNVSSYLDDLLTELEKSGEPCKNDAVKWISVLSKETNEKGYNISLSHGMSSIVALLVRLYQLHFEMERVEKLLNRTITYILNQITFTKGKLSYFPSYSKESSPDNLTSRLGWCYGDLGIAHILRQAAVVLKNSEWEDIALQILLHNTNRRNLQTNVIRDAGLCHGSGGIAHIFGNLFRNTGLKDFQETTEYWLQVTMQMAKYPDGLAGYKAWRQPEYGGSEKSNSLLEGVAGIGLVLLSYINSGEMDWDACLLLS